MNVSSSKICFEIDSFHSRYQLTHVKKDTTFYFGGQQHVVRCRYTVTHYIRIAHEARQ